MASNKRSLQRALKGKPVLDSGRRRGCKREEKGMRFEALNPEGVVGPLG